jgi:hypothetical protein
MQKINYWANWYKDDVVRAKTPIEINLCYLNTQQRGTLQKGYDSLVKRELIAPLGLTQIRGHRIRNFYAQIEKLEYLKLIHLLPDFPDNPQLAWQLAVDLVFPSIVDMLNEYADPEAMEYKKLKIEQYMGTNCSGWYVHFAKEAQILYEFFMLRPEQKIRVDSLPDRTCYSCVQKEDITGLPEHCTAPFPEEDPRIVNHLSYRRKDYLDYLQFVVPFESLIENIDVQNNASELVETVAEFLKRVDFFQLPSGTRIDLMCAVAHKISHTYQEPIERSQAFRDFRAGVAILLGVDLENLHDDHQGFYMAASIAQGALDGSYHWRPKDWAKEVLESGEEAYEYDSVRCPGETEQRVYCVITGALLKNPRALASICEATSFRV